MENLPFIENPRTQKEVLMGKTSRSGRNSKKNMARLNHQILQYQAIGFLIVLDSSLDFC